MKKTYTLEVTQDEYGNLSFERRVLGTFSRNEIIGFLECEKNDLIKELVKGNINFISQ